MCGIKAILKSSTWSSLDRSCAQDAPCLYMTSRRNALHFGLQKGDKRARCSLAYAQHTREACCGFETIAPQLAPQLFSPMHKQQQPTQHMIRPTTMMMMAPAARMPPTASPISSPESPC